MTSVTNIVLAYNVFIRFSLLTNALLSSETCFVHVNLLSMVTPKSLELEVHFISCWFIFELPNGPINWFLLRSFPHTFWGVVPTREFCLQQGESFSRALVNIVVTWSTDSPKQFMVVLSAYRNFDAVLTAIGRDQRQMKLISTPKTNHKLRSKYTFYCNFRGIVIIVFTAIIKVVLRNRSIILKLFSPSVLSWYDTDKLWLTNQVRC